MLDRSSPEVRYRAAFADGLVRNNLLLKPITAFALGLGSVASPRNREHIFTLSEIFIASAPIVLVLLRMSAGRRAEPEAEPVTAA